MRSTRQKDERTSWFKDEKFESEGAAMDCFFPRTRVGWISDPVVPVPDCSLHPMRVMLKKHSLGEMGDSREVTSGWAPKAEGVWEHRGWDKSVQITHTLVSKGSSGNLLGAIPLSGSTVAIAISTFWGISGFKFGCALFAGGFLKMKVTACPSIRWTKAWIASPLWPFAERSKVVRWTTGKSTSSVVVSAR